MDNKKEQIIALIFSIVGSLAIIINLTIKGLTTENILDSIKDLVGLLVTVAVFLLAYSISRKSKSYTDIARSSLVKLQDKYSNFLMGPRYNRENYEPEKGKGIEYLFITNYDSKSKQRAKLIPIQPLEEGVLAIYVQKGTLVYGLNFSSQEATDEQVFKISKDVFEKVYSFIQLKYKGDFEIIENTKDSASIVIDFYEDKMGKRKYGKAVFEVSEVAINEIIKNKRK